MYWVLCRPWLVLCGARYFCRRPRLLRPALFLLILVYTELVVLSLILLPVREGLRHGPPCGSLFVTVRGV